MASPLLAGTLPLEPLHQPDWNILHSEMTTVVQMLDDGVDFNSIIVDFSPFLICYC
jgi:hypothetical protein